MRYVYSTLRFVPDPARGECVNVGILIGSELSEDKKLHLISNRRRATAIDAPGVFKNFWSYVEGFRNTFEREEGFSEAWLTEVWDSSNNIMQFSRPAPVDAISADEALEFLVGDLLIDAPLKPKRAAKTKSTALRQIRQVFRESGLGEEANFLERPVVRGPNHSETFDFVVKNGNAVQLTQAWNFQKRDLKGLNEAIKAWAWTVKDIRDGGGRAKTDKFDIEVPKNIDVKAVYLPPTRPEAKEVFSEAQHAFSEIDAAAIKVDQVQEVADQAMRLLGA
jgi:DUF3037 family protein